MIKGPAGGKLYLERKIVIFLSGLANLIALDCKAYLAVNNDWYSDKTLFGVSNMIQIASMLPELVQSESKQFVT